MAAAVPVRQAAVRQALALQVQVQVQVLQALARVPVALAQAPLKFVFGTVQNTHFVIIKAVDGDGKTIKAVSVRIPVRTSGAMAVSWLKTAFPTAAQALPVAQAHQIPQAPVPALRPVQAHQIPQVPVPALRPAQAPQVAQVLAEAAAQVATTFALAANPATLAQRALIVSKLKTRCTVGAYRILVVEQSR